MKSNSEKSFGARIGNAEKLVTALQNFSDYQALKPEYSITEYSNFITNIKAQNDVVATKKKTFSLSIDHRHQIFNTGNNAIKKVLSPINGVVKVIYGKNAKESKDIAAIIAKLRGANGRKRKTQKLEVETISQSYQSYNSRVQFFEDLIVYLTNFGGDYAPVNEVISIAKLTNIYNSAIEANNQVMDSLTKFVQVNDARIVSYAQLSITAQSIKDSIKSQYGYNSVEYNIIKGLKI
jgi:hypothetical protein